MAVVTGAGAAGFRNVKPQDLQQDFGGDQSEVIGAAFDGASEIVKAVDGIIEAEQKAVQEDEDAYKEILADQETEQKRLKKWQDEGNLDDRDFDVAQGFAVQDGKVVYENQVHLQALQLKGGKRRRYYRNKRRTGQGKDPRYGRLFSSKATREGTGQVDREKVDGQPLGKGRDRLIDQNVRFEENEDGTFSVLDADGNVLVENQESTAGSRYTGARPVDGEGNERAWQAGDEINGRPITATEAEVYNNNPELSPVGQTKGPSKTDMAGLPAAQNALPKVNEAIKTAITEKKINAGDNPEVDAFQTAVEKGQVQTMWDYSTGTYNYVWKGADGKIRSMPVEQITKSTDLLKTLNGPAKVQTKVDAASVGKAIGLDKINKATHIDGTTSEQIQNNFNTFMDKDKNKISYLNTYDIPHEIDGDGNVIYKGEQVDGTPAEQRAAGDYDTNNDGILTNEELFPHFQEVYGGTVNSYYKASLTTPAPRQPVAAGVVNAQSVVSTLDQVVQSGNTGTLVGKTINGVTITEGATIEGNILTNRTTVDVSENNSELEGIIRAKGEVKVEVDGVVHILKPADITNGNLDAVMKGRKGDSVSVLDDINLGDRTVVQNYVTQELSGRTEAERKGSSPFITTISGIDKRGNVTGRTTRTVEGVETEVDEDLVVYNGNLKVGGKISVRTEKGLENAPDGTYTIEGKHGRKTAVTIAGGRIVKSEITEKALTATQQIMVNPLDKEAWKGVSLPRINIYGGYSFQGGAIDEHSIGGLYDLFKRGKRGQQDFANNKGITKNVRAHKDLENNPHVKDAYAYYLKTGKIHPGLLNGTITLKDALNQGGGDSLNIR